MTGARLRVTGLRARDLDVTLDRLALVTGDPGSGKTTVADAIRFLALGYVPALGKTEAATAALMRGAEISVHLDLPDGRWAERSLSRAGKGLRSAAVASWIDPDATATEHGAALTALFGPDREGAAEHLDLRGLMAASPAQRATRLEALLDATAMSAAEAAGWVQAMATCRLAGHDRIPDDLARAQAVAGGLQVSLEPPQVAGLGAALAEIPSQIAEQGIGGALTYAGRARRDADASRRQGAAAFKTLEARRAELPAIDATLDDLQARRDAAAGEIGRIEAQVSAVEKAAGPRRRAQEALDAARVAEAAAEAMRPKAQAWRSEAADSRAKAEATVIPDAPAPFVGAEVPAETTARAEALKGTAAAILAEIEKPEPVPPLALPAAPGRDVIDKAARARENVRTMAAGPLPQIAEIAGSILTGPHGDPVAEDLERILALCGAESEALAKARASLDLLERSAAEREALIADNEAEVERLTLAHEERLAGLKAADEAARAAEAKAGALLTEARDLLRKAEQEVAAADRVEMGRIEQASKARATALAERQRLLDLAAQGIRKAEEIERAADKATADRERAEATLAALAESVEAIDEEALAVRSGTLAGEIETIDRQIDALGRLDALDRELGQIMDRITAAQAESDALKAVEWALQRLRERDIATRTGPMVERIGRFLTAAGLEVAPYVRSERGVLDFGWVAGSDDVPLQSLSSGETVLYMAATAAAILALRAPDQRVLLIEAAELGPWLPRVMAGCEAVADELSQVIVCTCTGPVDPAPSSWQHLVAPDAIAA